MEDRFTTVNAELRRLRDADAHATSAAGQATNHDMASLMAAFASVNAQHMASLKDQLRTGAAGGPAGESVVGGVVTATGGEAAAAAAAAAKVSHRQSHPGSVEQSVTLCGRDQPGVTAV